ncbi:MAG: type II toxin-antitoxin system VapC family toxin [Candidatus Micrarchaeota archaeon]|nr:type II toxin-antitoxin system VapC family toxin [Candidatus Micrarchaeota archaeon]
MKYVDSNILIYAFADVSARGEACRSILNEHLATSTLTIDEVVYKIRKKSLDLALAAVAAIENAPRLELVPFVEADLPQFREFLKKGMQPRDSIHALTAMKSGCTVIYSEDKDFDALEIPRKTPW